MPDERYNRWQGLAIAQMSVAIALISGFSAAGLGLGLSLAGNEKFILNLPSKFIFALSLGLLFVAAFLSSGAVITRLLDFRLTARKARKRQHPDYAKPLKFFGFDSEDYGCVTWMFFWISVVSFTFGFILLALSIGVAYADRWH